MAKLCNWNRWTISAW